MNSIYLTYATNPIGNNVPNRGFVCTISLIGELLSERLSDRYRSIKTYAADCGSRCRFCFVLFDQNREYTMYFYEIRNLQNWNTNIDINRESARIDSIVNSMVRDCLGGIIN